ncbi:MAG: transmembrane 220 family protein [Saprospiraceae bacterium]|nr:transmembrane 220 family protein [Saprospiraceae bacterium]
MKIVKIVLSVLFVLFAVVQLNDVDPWAWVALYIYVALLFGLSAAGRNHKYATIGGLALVVIWMATLLPDFINWVNMGMPTITGSMKAESPHVELTREFLGLLIVGIALGWLFISGRKA